MQLVGAGILVAIVYQFFKTGFSPSILLYGGIGLLFFIVSRFITQRRMLTLTGVMVMWLGIVMHQSIGILLAGSYIVIASFLPHRSYTHSLLGLAFYAFILNHLQQEWAVRRSVASGNSRVRQPSDRRHEDLAHEPPWSKMVRPDLE